MPTLEDLARRAQGLTSFAVPMPLAVQWASDRIHELLGERRLAILRRNLELSIPAAMTTGTISATRGSRTITPNSAALTAWASLPTHFPEGWFLRAFNAWYRVQSLSLTLTLVSPFAEDNRTDVSYTLVQRYHPLPEAVYQLEEHSFQLARTGHPLTFVNPTTLTQGFSSPWSYGGLPLYIADAEPGPGDIRQLEISPSPTQSELITYDAYLLRPALTYSDPLPRGLEIQHLTPGLLADFYTWHASQPTTPQEEKVLALNEKARLLTLWKGAKDAGLMRLSTNQLRSFVLVGPASRRATEPINRGIHTAYDHVWSR